MMFNVFNDHHTMFNQFYTIKFSMFEYRSSVCLEFGLTDILACCQSFNLIILTNNTSYVKYAYFKYLEFYFISTNSSLPAYVISILLDVTIF